MRKLWLIFAQTVTISLALLFVVTTLKPQWLDKPTTPTAAAAPPIATHNTAIAARSPTTASYRQAAQAALPAVVHIYTRKEVRNPAHPLFDDPLFRHFFGDRFNGAPRQNTGLGSGVIVRADGVVVTNHHVVEGADAIEVALQDGRRLQAQVVGSDPETDLAVLRIEAGTLPAIHLAADASLQVGDVVLAIGNPFGVGQTVTMGIVSALGRSHLGINTFENFIQTDAAINPGNSGGALVDSNGQLVGINSAIYSKSGGSLGIGFAIPVTTAHSVLEAILRDGRVVRGWIGVEVQELTVELAESFNLQGVDGIIITGVVRGGPADRAGIRPGDILQRIGNEPIATSRRMLDLIAASRPGGQVAVRWIRKRKALEASLTIAERPLRQ